MNKIEASKFDEESDRLEEVQAPKVQATFGGSILLALLGAALILFIHKMEIDERVAKINKALDKIEKRLTP